MTEPPPPTMLSRPAESPEPLSPIRSGELVTRLHTGWAALQSAPMSRWRRAVRRTLWHSDPDIVGDLIRAVDALAERCDELNGRVAVLETITSELTGILGQEVTRLQAAVAGLQRDVDGQDTTDRA
jgi:hypothetical protein